MREFGFTPEDYPAEVVEVWPEHERALNLFVSRLSNRWLTGFAGPTGLDGTFLLALVDRMRLPSDEAEQLIDELCAIESGALAQMQANREAAEAARKTP